MLYSIWLHKTENNEVNVLCMAEYGSYVFRFGKINGTENENCLFICQIAAMVAYSLTVP